MAKQTATSEAKEWAYKTTGVHLPADQREFLDRVAFVQMIERHCKELEKELAAASR